YSRSATPTLPGGPSADTLALATYATHLLGRLWEPGTVYHKAGVVLDRLEPPSSGQQLGLFAAPVARAEPVPVVATERPQLMAPRLTTSMRATVGAPCGWARLCRRGRLVCARLGRGKRSGKAAPLLPGWRMY
ncbi:MAG: hypothetical protein EOO62_01005, partial [Hymenobacter sp.]